jgi:hypothetical protein
MDCIECISIDSDESLCVLRLLHSNRNEFIQLNFDMEFFSFVCIAFLFMFIYLYWIQRTESF